MLGNEATDTWADEVRRRSRAQWDRDPAGALAAGSEPLESPAAWDAVEAHRYNDQSWMADVFPFDRVGDAAVLEIGVGMGTDLVRWARGGARVTGVDLTPRCVDLAGRRLRAQGLDGAVQVMDAEDLRFADDAFDIVYSFGVLHHVPNPQRAFQEIRRVLRPGGVFFGAVYNRHSYFVLQMRARRLLARKHRDESWARRLARVEHGDSGAAPLVRLFTRTELRRELLAAGFEDVVIRRRHLGIVRLRRVIPLGVEDSLARVAGWYLVHEAR